MSGHEGRTKGKRFRKPQSGSSNVRERWRYLNAQTDDALHEKASVSRTKAGVAPRNHSQDHAGLHAATAPTRVGYDIDGDGQIDVREMRLAKFLDAMMDSRRQLSPEHPQQEPSESELSRMRQEAGRLLIAKEFVERNHDRLWRYGSIFTGKTEEQSAEFIATHKNFKKLMPFLESLERKRTVRSSQNLRDCMQQQRGGSSGGFHDAQQDAELVRQTWIETSRKVPDAAFSRHPLPELQPKKKVSPKDLHAVSESIPAHHHEVVFNTYGAIDVDGDGVIDEDEMKLNLRLQEATLDGDNNGHGGSLAAMDPRERREQQQHEGRHMMAKDFVERNKDHLWLFEPSFRDKSVDQVVHEIATHTRFAKEFDKLRAKERVLRLKSSDGVSNCLAQMPGAELSADPSKAMEFRRVRHRSELLLARRELLKPQELQVSSVQPNRVGVPQLRAVREGRRELGRPLSDTHITGLPKIYDAPVRIEATGSFSVTKWKFGT